MNNLFCDINYTEVNLDSIVSFNQLKLDDDLTVVLINVNSLQSNFNLLEIYLESFDKKPSVIGCTETWNLRDCDNYDLDGYTFVYNRSRINRADRVCMYVSENLTVLGSGEIVVEKKKHFFKCAD